jgi:hypothetical protein
MQLSEITGDTFIGLPARFRDGLVNTVGFAAINGTDVALLTTTNVTVWPDFGAPTAAAIPVTGDVERIRVGNLDADAEDEIAVSAAGGEVSVFEQNGAALLAQGCPAPQDLAIFEKRVVLACPDATLRSFRIDAGGLVADPVITLHEAPNLLIAATGVLHVAMSTELRSFSPTLEPLPLVAPLQFPPTFGAAGDLDHDGTEEVALTAPDRPIRLHRFSVGQGVHPGETMPFSTDDHFAFFMADIDGDGDDEIYDLDGGVDVWHGAAVQPSPAALDPAIVLMEVAAQPRFCLDDFNHDGFLDVIVAGSSASTRGLSFRERRMSSRDVEDTFFIAQEITTPQYTTGLLCGDVDGDEDTDVILVENAQLRVIHGNGETEVRATTALEHVLADIDGDGVLDILGAGGDPPSAAVVRITSQGVAPLATFEETASGLFAGDIDGDGRMDLLATCRESDCIQILRNTGTGFIAESHSGGLQDARVLAGDYDRDGDIDIIAYENDVFGEVPWFLWRNDDGMFIGESPGQTERGFGFFFDVDQTGDDDFVVATANGIYTQDWEIPSPFIGSPPQVVAADLDRNGLPDLVGSNFASRLYVHYAPLQQMLGRRTKDGVTVWPAPTDFAGNMRDFWPMVSRLADDHAPAQRFSHVYRVGAEQALQVILREDGSVRRRPTLRRTGTVQFDIPVFAGAPADLQVYGIHLTWKVDDEGFLFEDELIPVYEVVTASAVRDGDVLHVETEKTGDFAAVARQ